MADNGRPVAEHLGRRRMAEDMRPMDRCLSARTRHRLGRNLTYGLVAQALEGSAGGQKNMVGVHDGSIVEVVQDGVPNLLRERQAVVSPALPGHLHGAPLPVEMAEL